MLDISHPCLARLVERGPLFIKPNREELHDVFGLGAANESEVVASLHELARRGARNVLLTMGADGAYFSDAARIWHATAARVPFRSSLCAGDAALAAFPAAWYVHGEHVEDALALAMATGGDVAGSFGLGDLLRVEELRRTIEVTQIA